MIWRRVLVPTAFTLRELHGVIQVAMGWEGIHLYDFHLRAERYGSWEVAASSPDVTLAALRLRKGARSYTSTTRIPRRGRYPSGAATGSSHNSRALNVPLSAIMLNPLFDRIIHAP
jgi:hypothetical protein